MQEVSTTVDEVTSGQGMRQEFSSCPGYDTRVQQTVWPGDKSSVQGQVFRQKINISAQKYSTYMRYNLKIKKIMSVSLRGNHFLRMFNDVKCLNQP
jgi:hypothetical protein